MVARGTWRWEHVKVLIFPLSQQNTRQGHQRTWGWERQYWMYEEKVRHSPLGKWEEEGARGNYDHTVTQQHERASLNPVVMNFKREQWAKLCVVFFFFFFPPAMCYHGELDLSRILWKEKNKRRGGQVSWGCILGGVPMVGTTAFGI